MRAQPGRAEGGVAFLEQPQVEILEGNGGDMDVFFEVGTCCCKGLWCTHKFEIAVGRIYMPLEVNMVRSLVGRRHSYLEV